MAEAGARQAALTDFARQFEKAVAENPYVQGASAMGLADDGSSFVVETEVRRSGRLAEAFTTLEVSVAPIGGIVSDNGSKGRGN